MASPTWCAKRGESLEQDAVLSVRRGRYSLECDHQASVPSGV
jgi:hypothetical protein